LWVNTELNWNELLNSLNSLTKDESRITKDEWRTRSKSHGDWRSLSQELLVSRPIWGSWRDNCLTVTFLFFGGTLESILMLRPAASRPVTKHPSVAYGQIFITIRQFRVCWCRALSLTRARACPLKLLLALARAVILRSESRGTREHILLSDSTLPLLSPTMTHRAMVELFGPASTLSKSKLHCDWWSVSQ
jgi:hypothetical protein